MADSAREGRVSGYVVKLLRASAGLTQEAFAELLHADVSTVQGWESGRRPLMAMPAGSLLTLRRKLQLCGVEPGALKTLDTALEADHLLAHVLSTDSREGSSASGHPLGCSVLTRPLTEMFAWPFTGTLPTALSTVPKPSRRGPVTSSPVLAGDEQLHIIEHLQRAAEQATQDRLDHALLRRQAYYLASFDRRPETADWLTGMQRCEQRRFRSGDGWTPQWAVVRSGAHSLARQGDTEALGDFIRSGLQNDQCETANLNYWAYWIGEHAKPQSADSFMVNTRLTAWRGTSLARHLGGKLYPSNRYVSLDVHTLWALLQRRPSILHEDTELVGDLMGEAATLLEHDALFPRSRTELESVYYGVKMTSGR